MVALFIARIFHLGILRSVPRSCHRAKVSSVHFFTAPGGVECIWNAVIVPTCSDDCGGAGRFLSGLGFHRISVPRSSAEFFRIRGLGNHVCNSMPELGLDSLVAERAPSLAWIASHNRSPLAQNLCHNPDCCPPTASYVMTCLLEVVPRSMLDRPAVSSKRTERVLRA